MTPAYLCLETGYTLAEIRAMPAWIVEDILLYLEGKALNEKHAGS